MSNNHASTSSQHDTAAYERAIKIWQDRVQALTAANSEKSNSGKESLTKATANAKKG